MLTVDVARRQGGFAIAATFTAGSGVTALFGRSGAGKSSVIAMIAGLARPDRGRIAVNGAVAFDSEAGIDVPPHRRRIGCVFQDARLFPHFSVAGNLTYGMRRTRPAERYAGYDQVVDLLGLSPLLARRPANLSGGERQRVAIGRALLASPRLLLLDEPLASLDAARKAEVLPFIARLPREMNVPIVYVSHAMDEVLRLADTMVLLDDGRAVAAGPVEDLLARIDLKPLTGRYEAGAVLPAVVEAHDPAYAVTRLAFAGGALVVGRVDLAPGAPVRVRIRARDVALALARPAAISVQNILPAVVRSVGEAEGHLVDVALDVGGCPLWAQVTAMARDQLSLAPGQAVFALVKAVSLARSDVADRP